jgi:L-alanine-DL-glutamate epimerase-like enolase superfamily enzyme
MALLDICGKITGQPVANLLGGRVRDEISWFGFLQGREPTALASHATELKEAGFEIFYLKVGLDAKRDVEAVRLVREALGEEARIRVDANEAWDRLHAVRMIRRLHEHRIEWVEQPLVWYDTEGLAWLQDQVEPIIVPDQAIFLESEALMAVRRNLAPVFVVGFHESGGLLALKRIAAIANAGGVALNRHAVLGESGISTLAAIQVLATIPNLTDGNQVMDGLYNEDVLTTRPDTGSGRSLVGRDPGFGIDLDWAKVEYFSRLYAEIGQYPMCVN